MEGKQKISTTICPVQQTPLVQDHRILLIRNVSKYPSLYKNEFLRTPFLYRHEKQQMWNKITQESGFDKVEDAKCKWRSLINYLRQHMDNVAQKKTRRYAPNTDNPDDKYMKLTDWPFYNELEFIVPYVKYAASRQWKNAGSRLEISPNEIDLIIEGLETKVCRKNEKEQKETAGKDIKEQQTKEDNKQIIPDNEDEVTEDDQILKDYFENMLKCTLKLSRFHQNRIKQQILDFVKEQSFK